MILLQGPLAGWEAQRPPNAVTIGVFDGVHIGHRTILSRLLAAGYPTTVLTFDPHPAEVLAPGTDPRLITTIEERIEILRGIGIETVAVVDLSEIRYLGPEQFVEQVLLDRLGARLVVVGSDFQFGKDRAGDCDFLIDAGRRHGFDVEVAELYGSDGVVSSTRIRNLIEEGDVDGAATLLGSRFRLGNVVGSGDHRGRGMGFPTANLDPPPRKVIPGNGIYAAFAHLGEETHPAAVNVGTRPTFGGNRLLIEAFLLDFDRDIYGQWLDLEFVDRLRPELRFESVEALVEVMRDDVDRVRQVIEAAPVSTSR